LRFTTKIGREPNVGFGNIPDEVAGNKIT
jgi:hypothetical protein